MTTWQTRRQEIKRDRLTGFNNRDAVHENQVNTGRRLQRLFVSRVVCDRARIEQHDVRQKARLQFAAMLQSKPFGRPSGNL